MPCQASNQDGTGEQANAATGEPNYKEDRTEQDLESGLKERYPASNVVSGFPKVVSRENESLTLFR